MNISKQFDIFIESLKTQLLEAGCGLSEYIENETYLGGSRFSYKDHEFQKFITDIVEKSFGMIVSVSKCSQIGLSELFNRIVLSLMARIPRTGCIVSFPSKSFAQEVFKTRIAPIIQESPRLAALSNRDIDSASVKQFYNGSTMYALGGNKSSNSTLLNRPGKIFLIDEYDRQDLDIITGYTSRTGHAQENECLFLNISTPTVADVGIDAEVKNSRYIHKPYVQCLHCDHVFEADYYKHVKVPGFEKSLEYFTQSDAVTCDTSLAYLECPNCLKAITKESKGTVWKVEINENGIKNKIGIILDPFVAMGFMTMPKLVNSSLAYTSKTEFLNQGLGKVADKSDSTIDSSKIHFVTSIEDRSGLPIFGLDLGKLCHFMRGKLNFDTTIDILQAEIVPLPELKDFLEAQFKEHYFGAGVVDSMPYTDLVYNLVKLYPQLFSAIYVDPVTPKPSLYTLTMTDKFDEVVRQLAISKTMAMSALAENLDSFYTFLSGPYDDNIKKHFTDMRKVRDYDYVEEIRYKWVKSAKGDDHFFHSAIYLSLAAKLAQANVVQQVTSLLTIKKFNPDRAKKH